MILNLIPFVSVGPFIINSNINDYLEFKFEYFPAKGLSDYESYDLEGFGLSLFVENQSIDSIVCRDELLYKGRNIINMDIADFMFYYQVKQTGEIDTLDMDEDETQDVYIFDEIGLQIWCRDKFIVTAIASYFIE